MWASLELTVPPGSKVAPGLVGFRIEELDPITHPNFKDRHDDLVMNTASPAEWEYNSSGVWTPCDATHCPTAQNNTKQSQQYRRLVQWQTTGPTTGVQTYAQAVGLTGQATGLTELDGSPSSYVTPVLPGHNGRHQVSLAAFTARGITPTQAGISFITGGITGTLQTPDARRVTVGNLVITKAVAGDGNLDFVRYDPANQANAAVSHPGVSFAFSDRSFESGDRYDWKLILLETGTSTIPPPITGVLNAVPSAAVSVPLGGVVAEGVYGFDVAITKSRGGQVIDHQNVRSLVLFFTPTSMSLTADGASWLYQYTVRPDPAASGLGPLSEARVVALDGLLNVGPATAGPLGPLSVQLQVQAPDWPSAAVGEGRYEVCGADSEGPSYRDHNNKRLYPSNNPYYRYRLYYWTGPDVDEVDSGQTVVPNHAWFHIGGEWQNVTTPHGCSGDVSFAKWGGDDDSYKSMTPKQIWDWIADDSRGGKVHPIDGGDGTFSSVLAYVNAHGNTMAQAVSYLQNDKKTPMVFYQGPLSNRTYYADWRAWFSAAAGFSFDLGNGKDIPGVCNFNSVGCHTSGDATGRADTGSGPAGWQPGRNRAGRWDIGQYVSYVRQARTSIGYKTETSDGPTVMDSNNNKTNPNQMWFESLYTAGFRQTSLLWSCRSAIAAYKGRLKAWGLAYQRPPNDPHNDITAAFGYDSWVLANPDKGLLDDGR